jgi:iron complex outermembrane recepter protein
MDQRKFSMLKKIVLTTVLAIFSLAATGQLNTIKGKVVDENGDPIANATVNVINETFGTSADQDGNFSLEVRGSAPSLIVRAIGFATRQVTVSGSGEELQIELKEAIVQLPDLVVTAEKEEDNLITVPYSVSSIEAAKVEQYRIWNIEEISTIIPNLYTANPGDNRNVTSIRGVTTTSYDPAVATYIDGVNQFSLDTYIAPLFDVERIEVLRGPQSTLYGRNAMGGVINIITRTPGNSLGGFAELSAGGLGQQRYTAGIRMPLIKNKLFLGVAGMFEKSDGFYTNLIDGSDFDKRQSTTGNYYLMYNATNALSLALNVKHHANRNDGSFPLAYMEDALANPYTVNQNAKGKLIDNSINTSLKATYKTPSVHFSSLTSYQSNHRYYNKPLDGDFFPFDAITIINDYGKDWNMVKVFTEELKVSSVEKSSSRLTWTLGTYMFLQDNPVKQAVRFGEDAGFIGVDDSNFSIISTSEGTNKGIAFYGQATFKLTSKLDLTAGLRYDRESRKLRVKGEYQHDPDPNPMFETQPDTTGSVSFNAVSPKVSLQYNFNDYSTVYGSFSRGFRTGGMTQLGSDPSQPPLYTFEPEFSSNFELGSKHLLMQNRLQINFAAFYITVNDAQVPTLVLPDAITITRNTGELKTSGIEAEISITPARGLSVDYNLGITSSEYQELELSQAGEAVNLEGNKQIFTPSTTSRLAIQYIYRPKGSLFSAFARGELAHTGTVYFDLANQLKQSPYDLIHARVGVAYKNVELSGWARNLGDKQYIAYAYDFGAVHFGEPRNAGASVKITF